MTSRGHVAHRQSPGSFRCLVCKRYVMGTESGHCPNCGFVPPTAPEVRTPAKSMVVPAILVALAAIVWALIDTYA